MSREESGDRNDGPGIWKREGWRQRVGGKRSVFVFDAEEKNPIRPM